MDYILDSYIRACTLKKFLQKYLDNNNVEKENTKENNKQTYFIMHPYLDT